MVSSIYAKVNTEEWVRLMWVAVTSYVDCFADYAFVLDDILKQVDTATHLNCQNDRNTTKIFSIR